MDSSTVRGTRETARIWILGDTGDLYLRSSNRTIRFSSMENTRMGNTIPDDSNSPLRVLCLDEADHGSKFPGSSARFGSIPF